MSKHKPASGVSPVWWQREGRDLSWEKPNTPQFGRIKKNFSSWSRWQPLERVSLRGTMQGWGNSRRETVSRAWGLPAGRRSHYNTQVGFTFRYQRSPGKLFSHIRHFLILHILTDPKTQEINMDYVVGLSNKEMGYTFLLYSKFPVLK